MVDNRDDNANREPAEEEISTGRQIAAFVLTLIVLPFLFAGTCMPFTMVFITRHSRTVQALGYCAYSVAFLALLAFVAIRTKNKGIRWGIIVMGSIIAVLMAVFLRAVIGGF